MRFRVLALVLLGSRFVWSQAAPVAEDVSKLPWCAKAAPGTRCLVPPRAVYQPDPEYSEEARKKKKEGAVMMGVIVGTDGLAHDISVSKSVGYGLDEEAIKTVKTWKFKPGTLEGKPVAIKIQIEVTFHLRHGWFR